MYFYFSRCRQRYKHCFFCFPTHWYLYSLGKELELLSMDDIKSDRCQWHHVTTGDAANRAFWLSWINSEEFWCHKHVYSLNNCLNSTVLIWNEQHSNNSHREIHIFVQGVDTSSVSSSRVDPAYVRTYLRMLTCNLYMCRRVNIYHCCVYSMC